MKTAWVVTGLDDQGVFTSWASSLDSARSDASKRGSYGHTHSAIHRIDINEDTGDTTFTPEPLEEELDWSPETELMVTGRCWGQGPWFYSVAGLKAEYGDFNIGQCWQRNRAGGFDLLSDEEMKELLK